MAKKSNTRLNTNLDDEKLKVEDVSTGEEVDPDLQEIAETEAEDDITYTMGDIKVLENEEDEEKLDLKKINNNEDEEDEEWVDPEYIQDDYDPYLDDANYDMDNPYDDDAY